MSNSVISIEEAMIRQDASFMIGLFLSLRKLDDRDDIPFLLSSIDFYSLIIYEDLENGSPEMDLENGSPEMGF